MQLTPVIDDVALAARHRCGDPVEWSEPVERLESWRRSRPVIEVEHPALQTMLERSAQDLAALRISDAEFPGREVIAAGAPWFMTLFGRDSLITSWMALPVDPELALGTLQTLARFQGTTVDERTEEQPGRILHEMRFGETAELSLGPGGALLRQRRCDAAVRDAARRAAPLGPRRRGPPAPAARGRSRARRGSTSSATATATGTSSTCG